MPDVHFVGPKRQDEHFLSVLQIDNLTYAYSPCCQGRLDASHVILSRRSQSHGNLFESHKCWNFRVHYKRASDAFL